MEAVTRRHGNRLQINYESRARLHVSKLYPHRSSNGSQILVHGSEDGLYITWHGGKPLYFVSRSEAPLANGNSRSGKQDQQISEEPESDDEALFESDEEEAEDDDDAYPPIVQDLSVSFGSAVLHLSLPDGIPTDQTRNEEDDPVLFEHNIVIAAACADGTARLVTLPLDPPSAATKRKMRLAAHVCMLHTDNAKSIPRDIALTWTLEDDVKPVEDTKHRTRTRSQAAEISEKPDATLLVALATSDLSGQLHLFKVPVHLPHGAVHMKDSVSPLHTQLLHSLPTRLAFNSAPAPAASHTHLLVSDTQGSVRVYDTLLSGKQSASFTCLRTLTVGFTTQRDAPSASPGLAYRKKVLDAAWVCDGRCIIALLEDGEWGVWDYNGVGPRPQHKGLPSPVDFAIRGFVGDAPETRSSLGSKSKPRTQLAPMTPNTRRVRQEDLFNGPAKVSSTYAARGGLSVTPLAPKSSGLQDAHIVLWYGGEIYTIPSLLGLWSKSNTGNARDSGSLYGPGLSRMDSIDVQDGLIDDLTQLPSKQTAVYSGLGNITQRDVVVTSGHKLIVLASTRPKPANKALFARGEPESPSLRQDQVMLDRGILDLGGVDRMLDGMDDSPSAPSGFGNGRRVGFAT